MQPKTIVEKIWERNLVRAQEGLPDLLYVDLHLVHEVTSPQAFEGLRVAGRPVRRPDRTIATMDHNVPTDPRQTRGDLPIADELSAKQIEALRRNCEDFGIKLFEMGSRNQGIVHIIGPELGLTQPGAVIVCGDSHTATHGAFGALAFGIGTSEVEHVLATQTLPQRMPKTLAIDVEGPLPKGTVAKDLILHVLGVIGVDGGVGHVIEYRGEAVRNLSMEGRMTVCNMSIEGGARAGLISPDETTFAYLKDKPLAPKGAAWDQALEAWRSLASEEGAAFDRTVRIDAAQIAPTVTWGTTPAQSIKIGERIPVLEEAPDEGTAKQWQRAFDYMGISGGEELGDLQLDKVFIGSCTNGRIEDLRAVAEVVKGRKVADNIEVMVVPGSGLVKAAAEAEGIADVLIEAGMDWRDPGCSMCLGMNPDQLSPGERAASTSNRNFEGRQGFKGRTHLVSPAMAAAAAIEGRIVDVREYFPT
ncbi:MAG: 3-isopropylmalate dehydratase large subunit [Nitriliruptor sp.]|nr:MAG: 3-isopropylmalate dehydratase large subunit [Nitriliruptor sp.]